jgi:hypothetical protein
LETVVLRPESMGLFPESAFPDYQSFVHLEGELLKDEPRTRIILAGRAPVGQAPQRLILKLYRYPQLAALRTWIRRPKAEQEYLGLLSLREMGAPAVEPLGYGVERARLKRVRSCFLLTRFLAGATALAQCIRQLRERGAAAERDALLRQLGQIFRKVHERHFFLLTCNLKNILVTEQPDGPPALHFMDVPYSRFLAFPLAVRWGQSQDLALLLKRFVRKDVLARLDPFFEGYLPDPLGGRSEALRRRVLRQARARNNQTLLSSLVHRFKRRLKERRRKRRG